MEHKEEKKFEKEVFISINGKDIPVIPFVHNAFRDMIVGFVKNLKGYEKGEIKITIKND